MHLDICVGVRCPGTLHRGWRKQCVADVGGSGGGHILPNPGGLSVPTNHVVEIFIRI